MIYTLYAWIYETNCPFHSFYRGRGGPRGGPRPGGMSGGPPPRGYGPWVVISFHTQYTCVASKSNKLSSSLIDPPHHFTLSSLSHASSRPPLPPDMIYKSFDPLEVSLCSLVHWLWEREKLCFNYGVYCFSPLLQLLLILAVLLKHSYVSVWRHL